MPVQLFTAAISGLSAYDKAQKAKDAEKSLRAMQPPRYQPNQSILNLYQKALQKYETSPTDTAEYKLQNQNIKQGITQGLSAARERRLGGAITPALIQGGTNSLLKAAVEGERKKAQEFNALTNATQLKAQEEGKAFHQNSVVPFEKNYNLLAMKAAGNRGAQRTDTANLYNNASAAYSLLNGGDTEIEQQNSFGKRYGYQGAGAYNWAKSNGMNFGQYKRQGNNIGRSLMNWGY